jgi:ferredoxin-thioredoxin reductase catalytic subunit
LKNYLLTILIAAAIICPNIAQAAESKAVDISAKSGIKHIFLCCDYSQNKDFSLIQMAKCFGSMICPCRRMAGRYVRAQSLMGP